MEGSSFIYSFLAFFILLLASCGIYVISKKTKLPYTVLLFIFGIILSIVINYGYLTWLGNFKLTPEILFYVFLPILVFESAYNINYKELWKNKITIFGLAFFGLIISTLVIGIGLYYIFKLINFEIPFLVTLLFGALISATDPVAVLALFKSIGAPRRLHLIFEGESLFNDATSLALFLIILGIIIEGQVTNLNIFSGGLTFLSMMLGGIIFGSIIGLSFSYVLGKVKNYEEVEISLTIIAAHMTFILAELISHHLFPLSGIISTAIAGIIIGNYGRYKISPKIEEYMEKFWSFSAWIVNSLVFILMGLILTQININFLNFIPHILTTIIVVMIARAISIYIPIGIINSLKLEEHIPLNWQHLLARGSLRGALAIVMILMIPDNLKIQGWNYEFSVKEFLSVITISSIIFTLTIKALSMETLLKKLNINKLHEFEKFDYYMGMIITINKMLEELNSMKKNNLITNEEYEEIYKKYEKKLNILKDEFKNFIKKSKEDLILRALSIHALGIEKKFLKELFTYNEIDEHNYKILLNKLKRQQERLKLGKEQIGIEDKTLLEKIFAIFEQKLSEEDEIKNKYKIVRTRIHIINKTINYLNGLKNVGLPIDEKYFNEIINKYYKFLNDNNEILKNLLNENKLLIMNLEVKLCEKSLLKTEESIIRDLYEKEMISPKLYHNLIEEINNEINKNV